MRNVEKKQTYTFTQWLETKTEPSTKKSYRSGASAFLKSVYQTDEEIDTLAARYIKEVKSGKRNCTHDLFDFVTYTQSGKARKDGKKIPPNSLGAYMSVTMGFLLRCCGVEISHRDRSDLRDTMPKGKYARTIEADLTRDTLRKILIHSDVRLKALVLLLVSSGIRVGEALKLKLDDITMEASPAVIHVRGEYAKEGDSYISFMSSEAKEALQEWHKVRLDYIAKSAYRARNIGDNRKNFRPWKRQPTPPSEDTVFPFSYSSAERAFINALKAANLHTKDKNTNIGTIHIHMLRKYFLTEIQKKIPPGPAETLVGHYGYLNGAYNTLRGQTQQLAEHYRKGEPALLIYQDSKPIAALDERNQQFDEIVRYNANLVAELGNMKARMAKWEAFTQSPRWAAILQLFVGKTDDQLATIIQDPAELDKEAAEAHEQEVVDWDRQQVKAVKVTPVIKSRTKKRASE